MKKILMLVAALATLMPCLGQDLPDYKSNKNELNLGYFNVFELNAIGDLGIGYKRIGEKGAFRTGIMMNFHKSGTDYQSYQYNYSGYELSPRIGYELHHWYNRIRLHYGGDVITTFSHSLVEDIYEDPLNNRTSNYGSLALGIRPILGITFYLNKSISISTETYMDIAFFKTTEERTDYGDTSTYVTKGTNVGLGPLGIVSVNFHF